VPFRAFWTPLRFASWLTTSIFVRALISPEALVGLDKVCELWYTNTATAIRTLTTEEWQVRER